MDLPVFNAIRGQIVGDAHCAPLRLLSQTKSPFQIQVAKKLFFSSVALKKMSGLFPELILEFWKSSGQNLPMGKPIQQV